MKILHTSDWHLGHTLYNYDRHHEQSDMLRQIVEIVRNEQPDVFLLCGDVYHTSQPSATSQHLLVDTLTELHKIAPEMHIFVTAGNHDSPSRHDVYNRPWQILNVNTIGSISTPDLDDYIFKIEGIGYVIAVPYVYWRNMPENFYISLSRYCNDLNTENLPVVMMAHTSVAGVNFTGHDHSNEITVGGIDCISPDEFGSDFDYLALGHIHKPQTLKHSARTLRYSGTPLAVSFDENYEHSVSIINIEKRGAIPEIKVIPIQNCRPLVTIPQDSPKAFDEVLELVRQFSDDNPAYLRLNVEIEDFLPMHAREKVLEDIKHKQCRFCTFNLFRKVYKDNRKEQQKLSVNEFKEMDPIEVACRYASETNMDLSEEQIKMLQDLFRQE